MQVDDCPHKVEEEEKGDEEEEKMGRGKRNKRRSKLDFLNWSRNQ